jgi:hypothetical protein
LAGFFLDKFSRMPPHSLAVLGKHQVFCFRQWLGRGEDLEVFFKFRSILWNSERHGHGWVLENESVPGRGARDREARGIVGRRQLQLEQPRPRVATEMRGANAT